MRTCRQPTVTRGIHRHDQMTNLPSHDIWKYFRTSYPVRGLISDGEYTRIQTLAVDLHHQSTRYR